jgi:dolichol-phosphate mannosyltransferase
MPELAIIIPTWNERGNVRSLVQKIETALSGVDWEVVFVDDQSADGTLDELVEMSREDPRVRFIERIGRRGLSSACIEGFLSTASEFLAVMDADHQHDESLLPQMLAKIRAEPSLDIVIGSRFVDGGGVADWSKSRLALSRLGKWVSGLVLPAGVNDPMSGFFMTRRAFVWPLASRLSGRGFKILVDILVTARETVRFAELPYQFRERAEGESKLTPLVALEFMALIFEKVFGNALPLRFVRFLFVGAAGMVVHLAVLASMMSMLSEFWVSQMVAAFSAMTANFILNNIFTYRDRRITGVSVIRGLLFFYLLCSGGFMINMAIALQLYQMGGVWWLAGIAGGAVGAVWNFATNTSITWRER